MRVIAVDGPSASGKGTLGKKLAEKYGFNYLDTGLIYRQLAYEVIEAGADAEDVEAVVRSIGDFEVRELLQDRVILRSPEVSSVASKIATYAKVRNLSTDIQKRIVASYAPNWVVVDGRDIGTVVFPDAPLKLFITASAESRAERRYEQLKLEDRNITLEEVISAERIRDARDQNREIAPLMAAEDAVIIDTSNSSIESSFEIIIEVIESKLKL